MELYLFHRMQWEQLYNCAQLNVEEVPFAERFHPINGVIVIALFFVFELLYVPCLFAIWKHTRHSCYKLLFYIGITDMAMLFIQGLESGVFNFTGQVFCSSPYFIYVTGCIGSALFAMQTSANFFLALDRCAHSFSKKLENFLFADNRIFIWMGLSTLLGFYYFCFVRPGLYSGIYANWFMNPFEGYEGHQSDYLKYINPYMGYYNAVLTFGFPAVYLLFIFLFLYRFKELRSLGNANDRNWQISIFIQVAIICGINMLSLMLFAIMQHLPISKSMVLFQFYVNYFMFGLPPLIFLLFNKTIKKDLRFSLGILRLKAKKACRHPNVVEDIQQTNGLNIVQLVIVGQKNMTSNPTQHNLFYRT